MPASLGEEVIVGEVDPDQADALGAHAGGQADRDVGRVLRVVQRIADGRSGAGIVTELERDDWRANVAEVELREQRLSLRVFDVAKAIALELAARVDNDEVGWVEQAADVVDADSDVALRVGQFMK